MTYGDRWDLYYICNCTNLTELQLGSQETPMDTVYGYSLSGCSNKKLVIKVYDVLRMLTFLPMDEVRRLSELKDEKINEAKKIAAFEITKLIHGEDEAIKAKQTAEALFENNGDLENMPNIEINESKELIDILVLAEIVPSKGQARKLIEQGGIIH